MPDTLLCGVPDKRQGLKYLAKLRITDNILSLLTRFFVLVACKKSNNQAILSHSLGTVSGCGSMPALPVGLWRMDGEMLSLCAGAVHLVLSVKGYLSLLSVSDRSLLGLGVTWYGLLTGWSLLTEGCWEYKEVLSIHLNKGRGPTLVPLCLAWTALRLSDPVNRRVWARCRRCRRLWWTSRRF